MSKQCTICGEVKQDVGPKIVGRGSSEDPRLMSKKDVLITKIVCNKCLEVLKNSSQA